MHPLFNAGIQTHNILNMSLVSEPLVLRSKPFSYLPRKKCENHIEIIAHKIGTLFPIQFHLILKN